MLRQITIAALLLASSAVDAAAYRFAVEPFAQFAHSGDVDVTIDEKRGNQSTHERYDVNGSDKSWVGGVKAILPLSYNVEIRPQVSYGTRTSEQSLTVDEVSIASKEKRPSWSAYLGVRIWVGEEK